MKKYKSITFPFIFLISSWFLLSSGIDGIARVTYSGGVAANNLDRTGSPVLGTSTCAQCHNSGPGVTNVSVILTDVGNNVVTSYLPGNTYTVEYQISNSNYSQYGFQSVALTASNAQAGTFSLPTTPNSQISILSGRQYPEHFGVSSTGVFKFTWIAPALGTGNVTFYSMGNAVNGTGSTGGDKASSPNQTIFTEGSATADLTVSAYIEGYYDNLTGLMRPVLQNSFIAGAGTTECDTLTIELHESSSTLSSPVIAQSHTGVLSTSGSITGIFPLSVIGNSYYIVLKHRSALQTWSANPILMGATTSYDFSTIPANTFGSNVKLIVPGLYGMYMADLNYDGVVDVADYPLWETESNNFGFGYLKEDMSGDGIVDLGDYVLWENNSNQFAFVFAPF